MEMNGSPAPKTRFTKITTGATADWRIQARYALVDADTGRRLGTVAKHQTSTTAPLWSASVAGRVVRSSCETRAEAAAAIVAHRAS